MAILDLTPAIGVFVDPRLDFQEWCPKYATDGAAGFDLKAHVASGELVIGSGEVIAVDTGLSFEIPEGYEIQIRSRSGLALKQMVSVFNAPGTVDSDYRGEVKVILQNFGPAPYRSSVE